MQANINTTDVKEAVKDFLNLVTLMGDDNDFSNTSIDFLEMSFKEFLGSERFAEIGSERRKELYEQYQMLKVTLDILSDFTAKFPDGIDFDKFSFTVTPDKVLQDLPRVPKVARDKIKELAKPVKPAKKK